MERAGKPWAISGDEVIKQLNSELLSGLNNLLLIIVNYGV